MQRINVPRYAQDVPSRVTVTARDGMLFLLLAFLVGYVISSWDRYRSCSHPLPSWLVTTYAAIFLARVNLFAIQYFLNGFPTHCTTRYAPRLLVWAHTWLLAPFLLVFAILGCAWIHQDKDCLPSSTILWAFVCSIAFLLLYVGQFYAAVFRILREEARMRHALHLEPEWAKLIWHAHEHVLERVAIEVGIAAGRIIFVRPHQQPHAGHLAARLAFGEMQLHQPPVHPCLTRDQIAALPTRLLTDAERAETVCSICLIEFPQLLPVVIDPIAATGEVVPSKDVDAAPDAPDTDSQVEVSRVGAPASRVYSNEPVTIIVLPCTHIYHAHCLTEWLLERSLCPNCRQEIVAPSNSDAPEQQGAPPHAQDLPQLPDQFSSHSHVVQIHQDVPLDAEPAAATVTPFDAEAQAFPSAHHNS